MRQDIYRGDPGARRTPGSLRTLRALGLAWVGMFVVVAPAVAQDTPPRFQTTVNVTSVVDVVVVDSNGQPITGLGEGDFNVRIDGRERQVLRAEWVEVVEEAKARATAVPVPAGYTSNENTGGGRLIVIVIDRIGIRFGGNTAMMNTLLGFIDRLQPSDRVAVVGFGPDNPPLEFIADLERVKELVTRMTGQKQPGAPTTYNVGLGESLSIVRGELGMLDGAIARECVNLPPRSFQLNVCSTGVKDDAGQIAREALEQADTTIVGLSNLFTTLRAIDGPKTVVMVSEGFVVDDYQTFAETAGLMAAAAKASLYVMHLNDNTFDSGSGRRPPSAIEDRRIRVLGLEALTKVARGYMFTVNGAGAGVFDRIYAELSGHYLLSIEPDRRDSDGKTHSISIQVPWNGAVVRSRQHLVNVGPALDLSTPQKAVAAGLSSPLPLATLPLRVGTFALQGSEPGKIQLLIHADIGHEYSAARRVSIGYAIYDRSGREVDVHHVDNRLAPVMNGFPSALQFTAGSSLAPGEYTLRLAVADGARVGSVEHRFQAKLPETGAVKLSELMAGGPTAVRELLSPTIGYTVAFGSVHGYLEAYGDMAEAVTVKYEIATAPATPALIEADVAGRLFGDDRMIFTHVMPVQQLPSGSYVLRAKVSAAGRPLTTLTRPFEVPPRGAAAASTDVPSGDTNGDTDADVYLPVDEKVFARPLLRDEAVKPEVAKPFRDRLAAGGQAAFEEGLTALSAGDYDKAAARLKSGVQPDTDSTPLLAYLGVIYAATDDDPQAVGAWQTALVSGDDIPQLYAWLSQALLRMRSLPEAGEILEEAIEKWPSDPRFTGTLASVYATFGRGREAVRLLEQYLEQTPADVDAARVGVEWLYQINLAGQVVRNREDDLRLARDWAARYGKGPQEALVRQWLAALERDPR